MCIRWANKDRKRTFTITKPSYESRINFNLREVSLGDNLAPAAHLSLPDTSTFDKGKPGADLLLEFKLSINPSSFLGAPHHTTEV